MSAPPPGTGRPSSLPARPAFAPRAVKTSASAAAPGSAPHWDVYRPPTTASAQAADYGRQYAGYQAQYGGQYAAGAQQQQQPGLDPFGNPQYDAQEAAQIAQWQNAYGGYQPPLKGADAKGAKPLGNANNIPLGQRPQQGGPAAVQLSTAEINASAPADSKTGAVVTDASGRQKTVVRSGGGKQWQDSSLLEWDPSHPRLFVGNLAGEVTDESLLKAFAKYPSVSKAKVVRDKRTTKSKGFGFVSFQDSDDYFQAAKEMQGKYIGSHPVLIKRSTTEIKPTAQVQKGAFGHQKKKQQGTGGAAATEQQKFANTGAGIEKKIPKKKNGLRVLG